MIIYVFTGFKEMLMFRFGLNSDLIRNIVLIFEQRLTWVLCMDMKHTGWDTEAKGMVHDLIRFQPNILTNI